MEVHGGDVGDLRVLGAMYFPGLYYERGLLHPFIDYLDSPGLHGPSCGSIATPGLRRVPGIVSIFVPRAPVRPRVEVEEVRA